MIPFDGMTIDWSNVYVPEGEEILPFQKSGVLELLLRNNVLLADEMGLGKTIQMIMYMNITRPTHTLIVCPNSLRKNWEREIEKWLDPSLLNVREIEHCTSSAYFTSDIIIASYEGFTKWAPIMVKEEWDVIMFDEAHYLKNRSAKRTRAAYLFQDLKAKKIMATGTPICNYPPEVFSLAHFLDNEQWPSAASFERRYYPAGMKYGYHLSELQDFLRNGTHRKEVKKVKKYRVKATQSGMLTEYKCDECPDKFDTSIQAQQHVVEKGHMVGVKRVADDKFTPEEYEVDEVVGDGRAIGLMIRRLKKEVLPELPRKRRQVIELPAEGELLDLVEKENALWQRHADIALELERNLETVTGETLETDSSFESVIEALKFNKRYFFDEIAAIRHALARAKVPYVIEHLENVLENKDKVVLFIHHRDVAEAILDHFKDNAVLVYGGMNQIDLYAARDTFVNSEKCTLFIGSLKAAGVGLNLQVASHIVFAEEDWVPGVITQAEDRCHRIGQTSSLLIQHLVAANSMDSHMCKKIIAKQKSIRTALDRPVKGAA